MVVSHLVLWVSLWTYAWCAKGCIRMVLCIGYMGIVVCRHPHIHTYPYYVYPSVVPLLVVVSSYWTPCGLMRTSGPLTPAKQVVQNPHFGDVHLGDVLFWYPFGTPSAQVVSLWTYTWTSTYPHIPSKHPLTGCVHT